MEISAVGNNLLASRLENANLASNPIRTYTIVGLALNLAYLPASLSSPFMPSTATSVVEQLEAPLQTIPDKWSGDTLKGGHKIGKAACLFQKIDDKKEKEWREKCGGTQVSRLAEEEAKAKKKADKELEKERKKARRLLKLHLPQERANQRRANLASWKRVKRQIPLRGQVAEKQAPPPAAAP